MANPWRKPQPSRSNSTPNRRLPTLGIPDREKIPYERFHSEGRHDQGRRTGPEGSEAAGGARKGGPDQHWRKATTRRIRGLVQGEGLLRQHEENNLPAQGRLAKPLQMRTLPKTTPPDASRRPRVSANTDCK